MKDDLRFLLSGPGLIGRQHARLIGSRADSILSAIVGPPDYLNETFAYGLKTNFYPDVNEALRAEKIDAAIISSPNIFHFDQAMKCISQGIPVLVEKPITNETRDALRLANTAERLGVPILVGHHRTYSPLIESAEAFINSSRFGKLVAFQGSALFYKPTEYFEEGAWRATIGGGPILINLIHEIGLLRLLCGEIKAVSVLASRDVRKFQVEDTVTILLEFQNGALGTFVLSDTAASSKSWEMTSGENPAFPHFPRENCYHFAGTNGSLDFPSMEARWYGKTERSWLNHFETNSLAVIRRNPLELQLDHFVDVVRGNAKPKVSARDGYQNMLVIDAIQRSIASRRVVDVSELNLSI